MEVSFLAIEQGSLRLAHSFQVIGPIKFPLLRKYETVPAFYNMLRVDEEDVFFFHKQPSTEEDKPARIRHAVLDLEKIAARIANPTEQLGDSITSQEQT